MKWKMKTRILNERMFYVYSLRKIIIESVVQLNEEQLNKIYRIIKEEKHNTDRIASRIVCEVGNPIKGAGCGLVGTIIKRTCVDINKRVPG